MTLTTLALIILTPLLVWRIYARLKTRMARQRSIVSRHYTGVLVFFAMVSIPASELLGNTAPLLALLGGALAGVALGFYGLKTTRFEDTAEGYFYTPNARLGLLVAMALVARVLYLGVLIYLNKGSDLPTPRFTDSPLTMMCVGLAGAYFGTCSAGLLRWRYRLRKAVGSW